MSQRSGFSCQSAGPEMAQYHKISIGGGGVGGGLGGGGGIARESMRLGNFQSTIRHQSQRDHEHAPMSAVGQYNPWIADGSDAGSMVSDRDGIFTRQYAQSMVNGYNSMRQGGGTAVFPMHRSLSGTLSRTAGMAGGEVEIVQQPSFKGPAHRTISRIANRNRMSMGSMSGTIQRRMSSGSAYALGGDRMDGGFITSGLAAGSHGNLAMQRQGTLSRAMSVKSMHSVGRGRDIFEQMETGGSMGNLSG